MGTSTRFPGPRGRLWTSAARELASLGEDPTTSQEQAAETAEKFLAALADTVRSDPDAFGLQIATRASAQRMIAMLETLDRDGPWALSPPTGNAAADLDQLTGIFVQRIAGSGGLVVDAIIRQAATRCAERVLADRDSPVAAVVRSGAESKHASISDDMFCMLYKLYFADVISGFVKTVIAEKIKLAFPALRVIDPAGIVAKHVAEKVAELIPDPCEERENRGDHGSTLADVARDLLKETVDRALGLSFPGDSAP